MRSATWLFRPADDVHDRRHVPVGGERGGLALDLGLDLVLIGTGVQAGRAGTGQLLDDVHDMQLGAVAPGHAHRVSHRAVGVLGSIGGPDDLREHHTPRCCERSRSLLSVPERRPGAIRVIPQFASGDIPEPVAVALPISGALPHRLCGAVGHEEMTHRDSHPGPGGGPDRATPARSAELLEIVPCALMEVNIDAGSHRAITYFSGPATEMYGYSRTDVLGRDPVLLSAASPDEISRWRAGFDATGRWRQTAKHITKDGRTLDVELDGLAWRDETGRLAGYLMAIRDVTAETDRARRLDQQSALLQLAPTPIFALDDPIGLPVRRSAAGHRCPGQGLRRQLHRRPSLRDAVRRPVLQAQRGVAGQPQEHTAGRPGPDLVPRHHAARPAAGRPTPSRRSARSCCGARSPRSCWRP